MKIKVDWKTLGVLIWAALKPVLLAAIGCGIIDAALPRAATSVATEAVRARGMETR